ncbi:MAG: prolyl oligopeptidase family serine peptidase [Clostridia bacterium]|nr:prolyl oligopeptidase family serine peptidase [Clostridia bacterium]
MKKGHQGQRKNASLLNNKTKVLIVVLVLVLIIVVLSIIPLSLWIAQPSVFFGPSHDKESYSKLHQIDGFEEIKIDINNRLIDGWIYHNVKDASKNPKPLVIYYGGNMQNSSKTCLNYYNNDIFEFFDNYNFLMVDYPEFGLSDGSLTQKTMFENAVAVYDYASNLDYVDANNIVIMGYSIGSGIANYVASSRNVSGLIILAPYDELRSLYNEHLNIFYGPIRKIIRYDFKSYEYAKNIKVAPLVITSYDDEVISYKYADNLVNYYDDIYYYKILDNDVKHNDYISQKEVLLKIEEYLQTKSK